jgi:hypothetical protein
VELKVSTKRVLLEAARGFALVADTFKLSFGRNRRVVDIGKLPALFEGYNVCPNS